MNATPQADLDQWAGQLVQASPEQAREAARYIQKIADNAKVPFHERELARSQAAAIKRALKNLQQ